MITLIQKAPYPFHLPQSTAFFPSFLTTRLLVARIAISINSFNSTAIPNGRSLSMAILDRQIPKPLPSQQLLLPSNTPATMTIQNRPRPPLRCGNRKCSHNIASTRNDLALGNLSRLSYAFGCAVRVAHCHIVTRFIGAGFVFDRHHTFCLIEAEVDKCWAKGEYSRCGDFRWHHCGRWKMVDVSIKRFINREMDMSRNCILECAT